MIIKILGLPFDNGIRSMIQFGRGILGACEAPMAILEKIKFENKIILPLQKYNIDNNFDLQKITTSKAEDLIEKEVIKILKDYFLISIGGDHSLTFPIISAFKRFYKDKKIGLVYFDAHFDMRDPNDEKIITSGNSMWRIISEKLVFGENMAVFGINDYKSTVFLKQKKFASKNKVTIFNKFWIKDLQNVFDLLKRKVDYIYVSFDVDLINKKFAPGVSAQNEFGISDEDFLNIIDFLSTRKEIIGLDFMEASSRNWDKNILNITTDLISKGIQKFIDTKS